MGEYIRAKRKGFVGRLSTDIFGKYLFIEDIEKHIPYVSGANIIGEHSPKLYKDANEKPYYKVFKLSVLGLDGKNYFTLTRNGQRQTLRYVGYTKKKPCYIVHDKEIFNVKYTKEDGWVYQNPGSGMWLEMPFSVDNLAFNKSDLLNYEGDLPPKAKPVVEEDDYEETVQVRRPVPVPQTRRPVPQPKRPTPTPKQPTPQPTPKQTPTSQTTSTSTPTGKAPYKLVGRYVDTNGKVKGYGCKKIAENKTLKISVEKAIDLARQGKVENVKVVEKNGHAFLQGHSGFSIDTLPSKTV